MEGVVLKNLSEILLRASEGSINSEILTLTYSILEWETTVVETAVSNTKSLTVTKQ
jgi:hypothetical protein